MRLPTFYSSLQPVAVLLGHILLGNVVRIFLGLILVRFLGDDERYLDNAIFNGLRQRVVHDRPREVQAFLVPRRCREVQPSSDAFRQHLVDRQQRLAPCQVLPVNVMRLIVDDHDVLERFYAI